MQNRGNYAEEARLIPFVTGTIALIQAWTPPRQGRKNVGARGAISRDRRHVAPVGRAAWLEDVRGQRSR
jgi:hypothetical protein